MELESCHLFNVFVPLISQVTKCKIKISNFDYDEAETLKTKRDYIKTLADNVREFIFYNKFKFQLKYY